MKKKCDHSWYFQINLITELPAAAFHNVNKKIISSKNAKILGVEWDKISIVYCKKCDKATRDLTVLCAK